ncbi:MAG: hypothetical protein KDE27_19570, partial [Planctomycetes bacterium]|nr:hypothetical protein [Planctomycetota bacterium]
MSPWPEDVERVLERVVCGELAADAEEVRAVLARHPTAAAELEHLRAVQSSLGAFTADADEVVA